MLDRKYRIHQAKQYKRIFSSGKKAAGRYMVMLAADNHLPYSRIGMITSKKVGRAFERNFAKRRMRAVVRENFSSVRPGIDLVLIARAGIKTAAYEGIVKEFISLLKKGHWYGA